MSIIKTIYNLLIKTINHINFRTQSGSYSIGSNLIIRGVLSIRNLGSIVIGDNVFINSRYSANPVGNSNQTGLYTRSNGQIEIKSGVQLSNCLIFSYENVTICEDVYVGGGVQILDNDFHSIEFKNRIKRPDPNIKIKSIKIERGSFVGANSIILKGVEIGEESVIAAGSVVTKSVPSREIWGGNPAKYIRDVTNDK